MIVPFIILTQKYAIMSQNINLSDKVYYLFRDSSKNKSVFNDLILFIA